MAQGSDGPWDQQPPSAPGTCGRAFGAGSVNLEREVKLSVGPLFRLPDLSGIGEGVRARDEGPQRFVTSYHDTDDLRLARWGASLRYRTGEGWTVKLPQPNGPLQELGAIVRQEHTFEAGPGRPPAKALDLVRAFVRNQ